WNGASWEHVDAPQPPGQYSQLMDVTVLAPDHVVAGGYYCLSGGYPCYSQHLEWDGTDWTWIKDSPAATMVVTDSSSPDHAWGAGYAQFYDLVPQAAVWDGRRWRTSELPRSSGAMVLDVADVS